MQQTAKQLGVAVEVEGYLPRDTAAEELTVTDSTSFGEAELPDGAYALQGDIGGTLTFTGGKASLKMPASTVTYLFCD